MKWPYQTLVEAIEAAVKQTTSQQGYTFLEGSSEEHLSFEALWQQAKAYAGALQHRGVQKGDRVLLVLPTGAEFAITYMALLLCGAAPCVLPSPRSTCNEAEGLRRILDVGRQLSARLLITTVDETLPQSDVVDDARSSKMPGRVQGEIPFPICTVADLQRDTSHPWQPVPVSGDDLALIQASSGTTGTPKCIMLSHSNIVANLRQIGHRLQVSDDVVVCWLPLFHDMGLIGCFLFVLYWQLHGIFMPPYRFLRHPAAWLEAISKYGGTLSPAPNFAYALAARRTAESALAELELSTWRGALCGAEQIDVSALGQFAARFADCGFGPDSFVSCYGLAEASLCVTMQPPGEALNYERISRTALAQEGLAVAVGGTGQVEDAHQGTDTTLVCDCGPVVDGSRIRILDDLGRALPEGHVGSIWISGPSITQGYYDLLDETRAVLKDGWLNTGDSGYLRNGHLFVTGRTKDLIVIRGHNYYPTDFEWAAAEVPGITQGRVVAFGVYDSQEATEQLYLVCERPRKMDLADRELCAAIKSQVGRHSGVLPAHVGLVPRNTIPKTTSGKLQRARTKALYLTLHPRGHLRSGIFDKTITKEAVSL